ncbi:MAG: hypothetical protein KHX22_00510 [Clostridiales bacterium]|nr:hypothetical protein [Clostridiales bacterium]
MLTRCLTVAQRIQRLFAACLIGFGFCWRLLAAIVAHVPMESGKNGASFSAILYDTSDNWSRLRSESGEHCGAVPEYRTAYKTIIQKIS